MTSQHCTLTTPRDFSDFTGLPAGQHTLGGQAAAGLVPEAVARLAHRTPTTAAPGPAAPAGLALERLQQQWTPVTRAQTSRRGQQPAASEASQQRRHLPPTTNRRRAREEARPQKWFVMCTMQARTFSAEESSVSLLNRQKTWFNF